MSPHVQAYHFEHSNEVYIINSILKRNIDCIVLSLPSPTSWKYQAYVREVATLRCLSYFLWQPRHSIYQLVVIFPSTNTKAPRQEVCDLICFNITSWLGSKKFHLDIPCSWEKVVPKLMKTHCHHSATFTNHHNQH